MATVKDITNMCRAGQTMAAYEQAKADWQAAPQDVWAQREMGWALYYLIKEDNANGKGDALFDRLGTLAQLDLLADDAMLMENILWKVDEYVKTLRNDDFQKVSRLFGLLKTFHFTPSRPYSYLLKLILKFSGWNELGAFIEWWDMEHFLPEDYQQWETEDRKKMMSLVERVYIAYSKELIREGDKDKIATFIPQMEKLMEQHPDMLYPGYFCGKLMIALGADADEALKKIAPFAKKKSGEFWVWQLLGELFSHESSNRQLACLLRAAHCKTKEMFLGKVRMRIVALLLNNKDYARAKYHIDRMVRTYLSQGWRLPYEVQCWARERWVQTTPADSSDPLDFMTITNELLFHDAKQAIAVITYVDAANKRVAFVYGTKKRAMVKFAKWNIKVKPGLVAKIKYTEDNGKMGQVISAGYGQDTDLNGLDYVKRVKGKVSRKEGQPFAFLKEGATSVFIAPNLLQQCPCADGEQVEALTVLDYNKKKDAWNWIAVTIKEKTS